MDQDTQVQDPNQQPSGPINPYAASQQPTSLKWEDDPQEQIESPKTFKWADEPAPPQSLKWEDGANIDMTKVAGATPGTPSPAGATVSAHEPSIWETVKATVRNTPLGRAAHEIAPRVTDYLGVSPNLSDAERQRTAGQADELINLRPIAEDMNASRVRALGTAANAILGPSASDQVDAMSPYLAREDTTQQKTPTQNFMTGVAGVASGMATPGNAAIIAATSGLGVFAGPARPVVSRLISAGFTVQMVKGLYDQSKQFRDAMNRGDTQAAAQIAGEMVGTGVMAGMAGKHALTGEAPIETATKYVQAVKSGIPPARAASELNLSPAHQELAHVAHFVAPEMFPEAPKPIPAPAPAAAPVRAPVDGAAVMATQAMTDAEQAATRAAGVKQTAEQITGMRSAPPPPPQVPLPAGMEHGAITQNMVDGVAQVIRMSPPEKKAQVALNAVKHTSKWIAAQDSFVGPDGKVVTVTGQSPQSREQSARVLSGKVFNDAVERQGQQAEEQAKAQQDQAKQQQENRKTVEEEQKAAIEGKPASGETAKPEEGAAPVVIPKSPAVEKARDVLSSLPHHFTAEQMDMAVRNRVMLTTPVRKALVDAEIARRANAKEQTAETAMTGKPPEQGKDREELQAWADGVVKGEHPFVHVPQDSSFVPSGADGLTRTPVKGAGSFSGTYYHAPEVSAADIRKAARDKKNPQAAMGKIVADWKNKQAPEEPVTQPVEPEPDGFVPETEAATPAEPEAKPAEQVAPPPAAESVKPEIAEPAPKTETGEKGEEKDDWAKREDRIKAAVKASKAAGSQHVDQLPYGVETMRGVHFRSLRDGSGGTITTVGSDDLVRYQDDDGKDDLVGRRETEEWVVDGRRTVKLNRVEGKYVVSGPIPKNPGIKGEPLPGKNDSQGQATSPAEFKPGDKVQFTDAHGRTRSGEVRFKNGTGKYVIKGERKAVGGDDLRPAEKAETQPSPAPKEGDLKHETDGYLRRLQTEIDDLQQRYEEAGRTAQKTARSSSDWRTVDDIGEKLKTARTRLERLKDQAARPQRNEAPGLSFPDKLAPVAGVDGKKATVLTPTRELPATYRLVEADSLQPSHDAFTFAENPAYPKGVQERDYAISKEAQNRVIQQAQNYDPRYTVNTNPDAVNGPPIVTPEGLVLGGNSRAMSTQRLYATDGESYRATLKEQAAAYGFAPEQVDAMKKPVLVRQVEAPATPDEARRLGSELNKSMTGAMGVSERAVSAGKNIKPDTLRNVAGMMQMDDSTLREAMGKHGAEIIKMLTTDGVITERERPQFVDTATGGLSEEGKTFVERALMGTVIDDPRLMDSAPKSVLQKLERSLGSITSFASRADEWNLLPAVRAAVSESGAIQRSGNSIELHIGQTDLFGGERNPLVDALIRALDGKPTAVRKGFEEFARDADQNMPGQARMFTEANAFDAFNSAFGSKLTEQEYHDGLEEAASKDPHPAPEADAPGNQGLLVGPEGNTARSSETGAQASELSGNPAATAQVSPKPEYLSGGIGAVFSPELLKKALDTAPEPVKELVAKAKEEYANVRKSRSLQEGLYDLDSQANADVIRAKRFMESVPGTPDDYEAVYHHIEDPALPLTELQQTILDDYIAPLMAHTSEAYEIVSEDGSPADTYVHRIVKDRGGFLDRLFAGSKSTGKGNVLKTSIPSDKSRTMMAIEDQDGNRQVVSIKHDTVTSFVGGQSIEMGALRKGMTTPLEELSPALEPIAERIIDTQDELDNLAETEKQRQIDSIEKQISRRTRDRDLLGTVKGRVPGKTAAHGIEPSFGKRAELTRQIAELEKTLEAVKNGTAPKSDHEIAAESRLNARMDDLKQQRQELLDSVPTEHLADEIWKDKQGKEWKITQATTKEIEAETNLDYYHNAVGSAVLNWLAVQKQARAIKFLNDFKTSPDFATIAVPVHGAKAGPEGWKQTQLAQFRNYYFEPHVAEVLDWYNDRLHRGESGVFSKINDFLVSSIFFNPLLHVPNIVNHWGVEKGVSGWIDPTIKPAQYRAMLKAIDAVMHQNADFLAALDAGGALQSQQFETRGFYKTVLDKMRQDAEADPTRFEKIAKALGYVNPLKLLDAMKRFSSKVTWYSNDIFFLQAAYEKMETKGMDLKTALRETAKHIPDYRMPTRIFDSNQLQKFLSNKNLIMFMNYHYGAVKSYGESVKSLFGAGEYQGTNEKGEPVNAAGRTRDQEKMHGLDILTMLGLVSLVLYPLGDELLKKITGDKDAQIRRAGASTVPYNLMQVAQGEKSPWDALQSTVTPGVGAKTALELAMNRDLRTNKQIYSWPPKGAGTFAAQASERLIASFGPAATVQGAGRSGLAKQAWSMVGVSFPKHGAMRIASEIAANKSGSEALTPDQRKRMYLRYAALDALHNGDDAKARELMTEAGLDAKQRFNLRKESHLNPLALKVRDFTVDELRVVYDHANPEEKVTLGPILRHKEALARRH